MNVRMEQGPSAQTVISPVPFCFWVGCSVSSFFPFCSWNLSKPRIKSFSPRCQVVYTWAWDPQLTRVSCTWPCHHRRHSAPCILPAPVTSLRQLLHFSGPDLQRATGLTAADVRLLLQAAALRLRGPSVVTGRPQVCGAGSGWPRGHSGGPEAQPA